MELNLLPEDIDKCIKETIIKSALGKNIEAVINKALNDAIDVYNSPLKKIVIEVVNELVKEHLSKEENKSLITEAIAKIITPPTIEDILMHGVKQLKSSLRDY